MIRKKYKLANIIIIDGAELNVSYDAMLLKNACTCYSAMLNHFGRSVKPDQLLRKPQQTCHLEVEGLDAYQQSATQRSIDAELHAFLPLLPPLATVYPSPTRDHLMVFHHDNELWWVPAYHPLVVYQSKFATGTECMQV